MPLVEAELLHLLVI